MLVSADISESRTAITHAALGGRKVGLVPTMGALHDGHLSLIVEACKRCEYVAVTIFVNPTQFGPGEDHDSYPRPVEADLAACKQAGVDMVFCPAQETMYPSGSQTSLHVSSVTRGLCGASRPGHFDGVATIVAKLFNILPATHAFFGEKDYQQLAVIRRMVTDLNIPIEIVGCPTVREPDGLAMSSRNAYLSNSQRQQAASLSRALFAAVDRVAGGERDSRRITDEIRSLIDSAGPADVDYVEVVDAETLENLTIIDRPARICLAVRYGSCRLIDNVGIAGDENELR